MHFQVIKRRNGKTFIRRNCITFLEKRRKMDENVDIFRLQSF